MDTPAVCGTATYEDTRCIVLPGSSISFGRAAGNEIRVGHVPIVDDLVPRQAGRVFGIGDRLLVENTDDRLAFDLVFEEQAPVAVTPGMWLSPPDREFDIVINGVLKYTIAITANLDHARVTTICRDEAFNGDVPTGAQVDLTSRQRDVLKAYVAPVLSGGGPASHAEVASELHMSRSLVRLECNRIWSKMLLAGVPMRDLPDSRDQIVDAWVRHRL